MRTPSAWAASMAPAITDRAAFPVQRKTTWGWASVTGASGPSRGGERWSVESVDRREFLDQPAGQLAGLTHGPAHGDDGRHDELVRHVQELFDLGLAPDGDGGHHPAEPLLPSG